MTKQLKYLVMGPTDNGIGFALVDRLESVSADVRIYDEGFVSKTEVEQSVVANSPDVIVFVPPLRGVDYCEDYPNMSWGSIVGGLDMVLAAAHKNGVKRVVVCSKTVNPGAPRVIDRVHQAMDTVAGFAKPEVVLLRFSCLVGPEVHSGVVREMVDAMFQKQEGNSTPDFVMKDRTARRDFLHVKDAADAIVFFATKPLGGKYVCIDICSGERVAIEQLVHVVEMHAGFDMDVKGSKPDNGSPQFKPCSPTRAADYGWKASRSVRLAVQDALLFSGVHVVTEQKSPECAECEQPPVEDESPFDGELTTEPSPESCEPPFDVAEPATIEPLESEMESAFEPEVVDEPAPETVKPPRVGPPELELDSDEPQAELPPDGTPGAPFPKPEESDKDHDSPQPPAVYRPFKRAAHRIRTTRGEPETPPVEVEEGDTDGENE